MDIKGVREPPEEFIYYLKDKGRIKKINDTSKEFDIKFSNGITFYLLLIGCILIGILFIFIVNNLFDTSKFSYDFSVIVIIISGLIIFYSILVGITIYEKGKLRMKVSFLNDFQFKVNNKLYDIQKDYCTISVSKKFETMSSNPNTFSSYREIIYYLYIEKNNSKKKYIITPNADEKLIDFLKNFEFEISNLEKEKNELIKNIQNQYYDNLRD